MQKDKTIAYSHTVIEEKASLAYPNRIEKTHVTFMQTSYFTLGQDKEVLVRPNTHTEFRVTPQVKQQEFSIFKKILSVPGILLFPLKIVLGIRDIYQEITKESILDIGTEIFMLGSGEMKNSKLLFTPRIVSDVNDFTNRAVKKFAISLILPLIFGIGVLICREKVRRIEENRNPKQGVSAMKDLKCQNCLIENSEYILQPCSHLCICEKCKGATTHCPICGIAPTELTRVFQG